jgi:hypothetical protein
MPGQDLLDEIIRLKEHLRSLFFEHFFEYELFSWVWWLSIAMVIVSLVVWWKLVDKKRLLEICVFGLIIDLFAAFLDVSGSEYVLWEYPVHLLPQVPLLFPVDFVILPVIQMYIYQKFPKWGKFILVSAIASALQSFVAEPLAVLIGQYKIIHWEYYYSFPIYLIINIMTKFILERLKKRQAVERLKAEPESKPFAPPDVADGQRPLE